MVLAALYVTVLLVALVILGVLWAGYKGLQTLWQLTRTEQREVAL